MPRFVDIIAAAALGTLCGPAVAEDGSASAHGSATIVAPVSVAANHDLTLATVQLRAAAALDDALGGTIRVSTDGGRGLRGRQSPADFLLSGADAQSVSWTVPDVIALVRIGGTERITVSTWTDRATPPAAWNLVDGMQYMSAFRVGGLVKIHPGTVAGAYRGVLVATAQYN